MAKSFYRTAAWESLRKAALRRDKWRCQICGVGIRGKKVGQSRPIVDHIEPRPRGVQTVTNADVLPNLQCLCLPCSNRKTQHDGSYGESRPEIGDDGFPVGGGWG